ncbi:cation:proton antiporter [Thalassospira sp. HJ]|uniref:Na+/H+ antiporter subunit G n=1 Tax=unclassified Thalassospira TaxID=2648997 RepID=UPI0005CE805A|nr:MULTISPECIES: Na+/H+ antiporter subunit G [unclassified Thalassospira]KJE35681.1 cation:proton antiporter [Thalassospira sp. HJ]MBC07536.1 Na+/H+ antiporter subunit G [Thalassospira sp.]|tara:strand:- start:6288 stop:6692 length:405 start_codon:yes stop_codon:yes gene_type:complete
MPFVVELIISLLIVISGIFLLVGSFGMLKLRDLLTRLHAPTKASTVGLGGALIASMLFFWVERGSFTIHELLITLFIFLTAPITANLIAKAYMLLNVDPNTELPPSNQDEGWSTFDPIGAEGYDPSEEYQEKET